MWKCAVRIKQSCIHKQSYFSIIYILFKYLFKFGGHFQFVFKFHINNYIFAKFELILILHFVIFISFFLFRFSIIIIIFDFSTLI